jgi:hypothetical protein
MQTQFKGKKVMKSLTMTICAASAAVLIPATGMSQTKVEATAGADLVSSYIWRGEDCGHISIQPTAGLAYKGLSLTAWGSVGFDKDDTKEFDWTVAYSRHNFTIGVTDYWFSSPQSSYFKYGSGPANTSHVYEANLGYDFGILSVNWFTNFAGNDGLTSKGDRAYSSYCEIGIPFKLGGFGFKAELGVVPYQTSYYSDATGFAVTNIGIKVSKTIQVTPTFSIPLYVKAIANPSNEKAYLVAGITL